VFDHYLYLISYTSWIFSTGNWQTLPVGTLALISYWTLKTMYLKFLIVWRYFRILALLDGIEVPENMNRCMSNNYTVSGFWRSWHRSFNVWLVRYIYIPLGGNKVSVIRRIFNIFLIFTFVVFSHEPTVVTDVQILTWGWAMALFIVPEILCNIIFSTALLSPIKKHWIWRHLVSVVGSVNIVVLILANLCGYGITMRATNQSPTGAVLSLIKYVFSMDNFLEVFLIFYLMFIGTQIMLTIRKIEEYSGLSKDKF